MATDGFCSCCNFDGLDAYLCFVYCYNFSHLGLVLSSVRVLCLFIIYALHVSTALAVEEEASVHPVRRSLRFRRTPGASDSELGRGRSEKKRSLDAYTP